MQQSIFTINLNNYYYFGTKCRVDSFNYAGNYLKITLCKPRTNVIISDLNKSCISSWTKKKTLNFLYRYSRVLLKYYHIFIIFMTTLMIGVVITLIVRNRYPIISTSYDVSKKKEEQKK